MVALGRATLGDTVTVDEDLYEELQDDRRFRPDRSSHLNPLKAGVRIVRSTKRWIDGPDRASVYRSHYQEWTADIAKSVHELAGKMGKAEERLAAVEQDRERLLVLGNLGIEALREAIDRRRKMLGDAAVAIVFSDP